MWGFILGFFDVVLILVVIGGILFVMGYLVYAILLLVGAITEAQGEAFLDFFESGKLKKWREAYLTVKARQRRRMRECIQLFHNREKVENIGQGKLAPDVQKAIAAIMCNMVRIEGGTFTMGGTTEQGSDAHDDELPPHQVSLSSFYLGRYPITQREWKMVMHKNPSKQKGEDKPVTHVSRNDCQAFITALNKITGLHFRLPTEAEWEFAARGGKKSRHYKYAGSKKPYKVASGQRTAKEERYEYSGRFITEKRLYDVGLCKSNELGLYDMSGNVWEWCADRYGPYSLVAQVNPQGAPRGSEYVLRGGSWSDGIDSVRVSCRHGAPSSQKAENIGFRLAF